LKKGCEICLKFRKQCIHYLHALLEHSREVEKKSKNGVGHLKGVACSHKLGVALDMLLNFNLGCHDFGDKEKECKY